MSVPIDERGGTIVSGAPRVLWTLQANDNFQVTPDAQRFLVNRLVSRRLS